MLTRKMIVGFAVSCVAISGPAPQPVFAQESRVELEEIVVTARKVEENLQSIPGSISTVSASDIEDYQLETLDDIARLAPGFSFSKAFGRATERPVVRGLSNVLAGVQFGVEAGASYFVDGVYYPGSAQSLDPYDLERVEVVRGPQSALYGRNTYSGAINFITKGMRAEGEPASYIRLGYGQKGTHNINAGTALRISDNLGLRISVRDYNYDGEFTNLVTGKTVGSESSSGFSAALHYENDQTRIKTRFQYGTDDDGTRPFFLQPAGVNNCYPAAAGNTVGPRQGELAAGTDLYYCGAIKPRPIALNDGPFDGTSAELAALGERLGLPAGLQAFPGYGTEAGVAFSGVERDQYIASVLWEQQLGRGAQLAVAVGYRQEEETTGSDSDHSPVNGTFIPNTLPGPTTMQESTISISGTDEDEDYSVEIRLDSDPEKSFRWRAGLYYYSQELEETDIGFSGSDSDGRLTDESTLSNVAVFGTLSNDFSDRLSLDFELRWQKEERESDSFDNTGAVELNQDGSFTDILPKLSLTYLQDEQTTLYGIVSRGAKPGGFNGANGVAAGILEYEQELNTSFEVGYKKLWSNSLRTNLALYYSLISDVQGTEPVPLPNDASTSIVKNSGDGRIVGLEFELDWLINDHWDTRISYALAHSEYTEGCDDTQFRLTSGGGTYFDFINLTGASTDAERLAANPNGAGDCSIEGNQFAFSPRHSASGIVNFSMPLPFAGMDFFASANVTYEGKKYAQVHNGAYVDAVILVGARLGVRNEKLSITVTGRNLSDDDTPILVTRWLSPTFGSTPRWFFANPRPGRYLGVEVSYKF